MSASNYNNNLYESLTDAISKTSEFDISMQRWVKGSDIMRLDDEGDNSESNYAQLFDLTAEILSHIPEEEMLQNPAQNFMNEFNQITSDIISYTLTNPIFWQVDLRDKFIWIALMTAIKTCPALVKYLVILANEQILLSEDNYNCNCFIVACNNIASLYELIDASSINNIHKITQSGISPFNLLCYTGGITSLINDNKITIEMVLASMNNTNKLTALHFATMQNQYQPHTLEFLLSSDKLTEEHLLTQDINGNTPLHIACIYKADKSIQMIIKSEKLSTSSILLINNNANQSIFACGTTTNLIKYILEFGYPKIDQETFVSKKLYTMINRHNVINMIKSGILTSDVCITPLEQSSYVAGNGSNCILDMLLISGSTFITIMDSQDEKVKEFMTQLTSIYKGFLSLLYNFGTDYATRFIESPYIQDFHFTIPCTGATILQKISINSNDNNRNSTQRLITAILNCPKLERINDKDFISMCMDRFPSLFGKVVEKGNITENICSIVETLITTSKFDALQSLFDQNIIKPEILKEEYQLIMQLININETYFEYMLDNNLFDIIVTLFTSIIGDDNSSVFQLFLPYELSDKCFEKMIINTYLTKEILNSVGSHYGGILNQITSIEKLNIVLNKRPDFDVTLLFTNYLHKKINENFNIAQRILNHNLFTLDHYNQLYQKNDIHKLFAKSTIGELLINHKFFNKDVFKYHDNKGNNLIGYMIINRYSLDLIKTVIDKNFVTIDIMKHNNTLNENILLVACKALRDDVINLIAETYKLINVMQYLMTSESSSHESVMDKMYESPNIKLITKYIRITNNIDILSKSKNNKTLLHNMFKNQNANNNLNDIYYLLKPLKEDKIVLLLNTYENDKTCMHILMSKYDANNIIKILSLLNDITCINKEDEDDEVNSPLYYLIVYNSHETTIKVIEYIMTKNVLNHDTIGNSFISMIIQSCQQIFPIFEKNKINVSKLLTKTDLNGNPFYFLFTDNDPIKHGTDIYYTNESMVLRNTENTTLVDYIMKTNNMNLIKSLIDRNVINKTMIPNMKDISEYNSDLLKILICSDNFSDLFNESNMVNYISTCITKCSNNVGILTKSKYFGDNVLQKLDKSLMFDLCKSYSGIKYIFDNGLTTEGFIKMNNYALVKTMNNPQYLKRLINQIQLELLCEIRFDNDGTILHKLAQYPNMIKYFLSKDNSFVFEKILLETNNKHETFMHTLVINEHVIDIDHILTLYDNNNIITALFDIQDTSNDNPLMMICRSDQNVIQNIFIRLVPYIMNSSDILLKTDRNGNSLLSLASKFVDVELWKTIIDTVIQKEFLLETIETLTVSNHQNLKILLQKNDLKEFINQYNNFTKCFALACRYSPKSIPILLETNKVDLCNCYDVIKIQDENGVENYIANYVQIACRYNPDSLRELINCNIKNFTDALSEQNIDNKDRPFNAFVLAIMYEPDAVKLLINSKYMTSEYIQQTSQLVNTSCLQFAYETQIASCVYMLQTNNNNFKKDPNINYNIPQIFAQQNVRATYNNMGYQNDLPIYKHKDVMCPTSDPNACSVCCSNKMAIIFAPCGHKSCVSCSIKLHSCPQCRSAISYRLTY